MRKIIAKLLRKQAQHYISKNNFTIVVVSGSVGKTSTTQAIAKVLSENYYVRSTVKNYNSDVGVPLSIFNQKLPESLKNPFAWIWIFTKNTVITFQKPKFTVLVLELGTDIPGEIAEFSWLKPDIAVVTAIAEEHMEYFKTLDAVAEEELTVSKFSDKTLINKRMVDSKYLKFADTDELYNYDREDIYNVGLVMSDLQVNGEHSVDSVSAGVAVGKLLGMDKASLAKGAKLVEPLPGRMNKLSGIKNSTIIDDTYNSSPEAAIAALDYVYTEEANHKIVLLGNMNELGGSSKQAHERIGEYCDPNKIDLVITLGPDANNYTATKAKEAGCEVIETVTPYEAADKIIENLKSNSLVLCKGSQNKVFAEEAVKLLLENPEDSEKLVRQSTFWLKKKQESFKV